MSQTINVRSTVAQADGFSVEVQDTSLLCTRYFPTTAGDEFQGKEVLFDFDSSDLEKGAFLTKGYKTGNTVSWVSNSVIPPRVGTQDTIDPTDLDRVLFERLCRMQGEDLNRATAFQDLLNLKAARLAYRTDRAKELLAALVLKEGKIDFDQDSDSSASDTDRILCKFYSPTLGANNHYVPPFAWSQSSAKPYRDICEMVNEGIKRGRRYTDLLLGANAWVALSKDDTFAKFSGVTFHSEGMYLDFGEIEGAQHVASAVFSGLRLDVIVYSGAYLDPAGGFKTYIDTNAAILISEGVGRCLQGGTTMINPNGTGMQDAFVSLTGTHMQSLYKDYENQKLYIREESRPLPAPKYSVNEMGWIYCDTSLSITGGAFGEVARGVVFDQDDTLTWDTDFSCSVPVVIVGKEITITQGTVSGSTVELYAMRDGKKAEKIAISSNKIIIPADCDRDEDDKFILYATATA